jgi:hypothetical protein
MNEAVGAGDQLVAAVDDPIHVDQVAVHGLSSQGLPGSVPAPTLGREHGGAAAEAEDQ